MKKYTVELSNWSGGEWRNFWLYKNARRYAKEEADNWLWVNIKDNWRKTTDHYKTTDTSLYYRDEAGNYNLKRNK